MAQLAGLWEPKLCELRREGEPRLGAVLILIIYLYNLSNIYKIDGLYK